MMNRSWVSWIVTFIIINIFLLLRFMDFRTSPAVMVFLFLFYFFIVLFLIRSIPDKKKVFRLKTRTGLFLLIIITIGVLLKLLLLNEPLMPTETEWEYKINGMNYAQGNITGSFGEHSQMMSFFLTIFFSLFGVKSFSVVLLGLAIYILTTLIVFYASKDIFKNSSGAIFSTIIFSVILQTFQYYTSAEPEPLGAMFLVFAVWMVWKSIHSEKFLVPAAIATGIIASAKAELIIFAIPLVLYYIFMKKSFNMKTVNAAILFLFTAIPGYVFFFAQKGFRNIMNRFFPKYFTFQTEEFPLDYTVSKNLSSFFSNLFNLNRNPLFVWVLFLAGFLNLKKHKQELSYLGSVLLMYVLVYSLFVFNHQMRYIILIYPVLSIWLGHGMMNIYSVFKKNVSLKGVYIAAILIIALILSSGIIPELQGKSFRFENSEISLSEVHNYIDEDMVIICEPELICAFELFPYDLDEEKEEGKDSLCISLMKNYDYCSQFIDESESSRVVYLNDAYKVTKIY